MPLPTPAEAARPSGRTRRGRGLLAAVLSAGAAALAAAAMVTAPSAPTAAAPVHDPVIMIPGMTGTTSSMETMKSNLQ
ncbi:hypothetical protein, partial [Actinomadura kijaniata]|uniref:hypothetical protein n=1 Tax=Actinomadura kijaniata TaxID=46161 RepID=UPI001C3F1648